MEQTKSQQRNGVIWLGRDPDFDIRLQYEQRGLILHVCTLKEVTEKLNFSRAIVIPYDEGTPKLARCLIENGVYQYGTLVIVTVSSNSFTESQRQLQSLLQKFAGRLEISAAASYKMAQRISHYNPGPSENTTLPIAGFKEEDLRCRRRREDVEQELQDLNQLLRRAFWDCKRLEVTLLPGGSSSLVFRADVFFPGPAGPNPLPFFVKYDYLNKISIEQKKYELFVSGYIPFNHRPNLIPERCVEGTNHGLLVGNFVEHSEPLADIALRGTFTSSIYSLFHQVMRGWQSQAYCEPQVRYSKEQDLTLVRSLVEDEPKLEIFPKKSLNDLVEQEVKRLGCKTTPAELIYKVESFPPVKHLRGPIHGDLHCWNVHVRGTDAILIDFYQARLGPLLWDSAALEVSMCFGDLFEAVALTGYLEDWRRMVEQVYHEDWICCPLKPPNYTPIMEGIWICVREIRLYGHGLQAEAGTYQQALAIQLLRRSLRNPKQLQPGSWEVNRLAHAYLLAERLLKKYGG